VIDDHLLRDVLVGERTFDLGIGADGVATTGLWLFRLCSSFADPTVVGKLSAPVVGLSAELQAEFRSQLIALPPGIKVLHMRELAWLMADLQGRHRGARRLLSAAMVEALAAAHQLGAGIAVSANDVGPHLRAAARADRVPFHVM
jgi:uncharacterized protein (DUF1501 family)